MKCDELKDYNIMDIEAMDNERLEKSESGKIQVTRVYIKAEVDKVIAELKNEADVYKAKYEQEYDIAVHNEKQLSAMRIELRHHNSSGAWRWRISAWTYATKLKTCIVGLKMKI